MSKLVDNQHAQLASLSIDAHKRPTGQRRTWILLVLGLAVIAIIAAGGAWWYYRTTGQNLVSMLVTPPQEVRLLAVPVVDRPSGAAALVANGKIVSDLQVKIATKVSGQIVELNVEQGDTVAAGQILARVEEDNYRAVRDEQAALVARRRFEVELAEAEKLRAERLVEQRRAELEFAERNYERLKRLHGSGSVGDFEFYNAKNLYEAAAAARDQALASVQSAAASIDVALAEQEAAEASLRLSQKRLDDCAIRSPIAGVVLERNAQLGDFLAAEGGRGANANAQLVEIADMSLMRVEIDVSERDVHRLSKDQVARITPDADKSRTYDGRILWIDPLGDYAKATVQVKVRIVDPQSDLRIGGSAKVEFLRNEPASEKRQTTVWLPKSAVKITAGSKDGVVFSVVDDAAVAHAVVLGALTDTRVEVVSGVRGGMDIVADDVEQLEDQSPVRVISRITEKEL